MGSQIVKQFRLQSATTQCAQLRKAVVAVKRAPQLLSRSIRASSPTAVPAAAAATAPPARLRSRSQQQLAQHSATAAVAAPAALGAAWSPAYILPGPPSPGPTKLSMAFVVVAQQSNLVEAIANGTTDMANTHIPISALLASNGSAAVTTATTAASAEVEAVQPEPQVYQIKQLQQQAEEAAAAVAAGAAGQTPVVPDPTRPFTITMTNARDGRDYVVAHYEPAALQQGQHSLADLLSSIYNSRDKEAKIARVSAPRNERMVMAGVRVPKFGGGNSCRYGRYVGDEGPEADLFSLTAWPGLMMAGSLAAISGFWAPKVAALISNANRKASQALYFSKLAALNTTRANTSRGRAVSSRQQAAVAAAQHAQQPVVAVTAQAPWLSPGVYRSRRRNPSKIDTSSTSSSRRRSSNRTTSKTSSSSERVPEYRAAAAPNFPSPCLLGSVFTTLAVTHNYYSLLHAEPNEHPFSFITWLDVLHEGTTMEVGYFWLTAALAFTPLPGSALYIDVRLVPHRSDACVTHNRTDPTEGRYGAAMFIKPGAITSNARLWAEFDSILATKQAKKYAR